MGGDRRARCGRAEGDGRRDVGLARLRAGLLLPLLLLAVVPAARVGDAVLRDLAVFAGEPVTYGNEVELLIGGQEYFPRRLRLIKDAEHSIDIFMYLWCSDESGMRIAEALASAAGRGVRVRIAVDFFNSKNPAPVYELLEEAGVDLVVFNPPRWGWSLQNRMHEKVMLVDGTTVLVGGANLCDEYMIEEAARGLWQDYEILVQGPAAFRAQTRFDETWSMIQDARSGARDRHAAVTSSNPSGGRQGVATAAGSSDGTRERFDSELVPGGAAALIHFQQPYRDRGAGDRSMQLYCALFDSATSRIVVHTPYLAPPSAFKNALVAAASRGVDVHVITNSPNSSDMLSIFTLAARSRYRLLIEAGVRIFESPRTTIHGKAIVIDGTLAAVGSHNFTHRSFRHNGEIKIITDDPKAIARLLAVFDGDMDRFDEITLDALEAKEPRGALRWIGRWAGRLY